jgi:hypothetical protein
MSLSRLLRVTALVLIAALLGNSVGFAAKKPVDPAVMKARVQARGIGQGVRVTFVDKTEVKGTIVAFGEQSFALKSKGAAQPREIEYVQITGVHNAKLSRGQKVAIVVGVVGAAIVVMGILFKISFDKSFSKL